MKKNIFCITHYALLVTLIIFPIAIFAADYTLLQSLPGLDGDDTKVEGLSQYLGWLYKFALAAAAFLAVLMIVIGGIQMIVGGASETARSDGKKRIEQAIWGLLLAITAWLVLYSINPDLVKTGLTIPPITIEKPVTGAEIPPGQKLISSGSFNSVRIKQGICPQNGCTLDSNIVSKVEQMNVNLRNSIGDIWHISEAFPPTYTHKSQCHNNGTCFDANFVGNNNPPASNVSKFIDGAKAAGLRAVYEVKDDAQYKKLISDGVESKNIMKNPDASENHFHVTNI